MGLAELQKEGAGRDEELTRLYAVTNDGADATEAQAEQIRTLEQEQRELLTRETDLLRRKELDRLREEREMLGVAPADGEGRTNAERGGNRRFLSVREAVDKAGGFGEIATGRAAAENIDPRALIMSPDEYERQYAILAGAADAPRLPFILPGVTPLTQAPPMVTDRIPTIFVNKDVVRFRRRKASAGNRVAARTEAQRSSGANVADTTPEYEDADTNIRNYAGFSDVANEDLDDVEYVESQVLADLRTDISVALNTAVVSGAGTGDTIEGLLNSADRTAAEDVPASDGNALVSLGLALGKVRANAQRAATTFIMHPTNYAALRTKVENGIWAAGAPTSGFGVGFFGREVIEDTNVTLNTALAVTFGADATFLAMRQVAGILRSEDTELKSLRTTFVGQVRAALVNRLPAGTISITNLQRG